MQRINALQARENREEEEEDLEKMEMEAAELNSEDFRFYPRLLSLSPLNHLLFCGLSSWPASCCVSALHSPFLSLLALTSSPWPPSRVSPASSGLPPGLCLGCESPWCKSPPCDQCQQSIPKASCPPPRTISRSCVRAFANLPVSRPAQSAEWSLTILQPGREITEEVAARTDTQNEFPPEMWRKLGDAG